MSSAGSIAYETKAATAADAEVALTAAAPAGAAEVTPQ
jgi:hypothetical protein